MADLAAQAELRPEACPRRDREDCLRGAIACWNSAAMRERAAEGHYENMLSVALDGSQDHLGRGNAARFWAEAGMTQACRGPCGR